MSNLTPEEVHSELLEFRIEFHKEFGQFKADLYKSLADLYKTLWLTQLTTIGIVLVGVGLLIHFHV
jgi:hypothetical protein